MLVTLEIAVLDPKHDWVECDWDDDHHCNKLHIRAVWNAHHIHGLVTKIKDLFIERNLLEEHHEFADEHTTGPNENLEHPDTDVYLFVWITFSKRNIFAGVDSAF